MLYSKKFLHIDVSRREIFMKLAPSADDIWFWAMAVLNDKKIVIPSAAMSRLIYIDIDMQRSGETLFSKNKTENDFTFRRVVEKYPALLEKLICDTVNFKPYLSVVLLVKDSANILRCLQNFFSQHFPDFELILINIGSRIKIPPLPTNFQIINYPGVSVDVALNLGLQKSAGKYILFIDESSYLSKYSLDFLAHFASTSKGDVIHFEKPPPLADIKFMSDHSSNSTDDSQIFLDNHKQKRAAFWLQNKLSKRLDTKIFRREFLFRYEIKFGKDTSEFLFQALIQAEKYLLVPQVFSLTSQREIS